MKVAKVSVLGLLIAGCFGGPALGGPMLVLGTFSTQPTMGVAPPSTPSRSGFAPAWMSSPLRLGVSDQPNDQPAPAAFSAAPAPTYLPPSTNSADSAPPAFARLSSAPAPAAAPPGPSSYDAFLNLGNGPYPNSETLTTGNAKPWYQSQPVANVYGGPLNSQQQADFNNAVLQRVDQTFRLSGVPVSLTTDPNAQAAHTLSVVGNTANPSMPGVIGMTYIGGNGFHFIDQSANSARTVDQLQWIVAHNVAHELMLAFGVPEVHDQSGRYIDSTTGNWLMMTDPNARFSPEAAQALLSKDFQSKDSTPILMGAQLIDPEPVPEPATLALWGLGGLAAWVAHRGRAGRREASASA
ncbi:PEP-CTERM sorting domain-containing protein [Tundrisphaera lichenicola]|uniref:PEP-CTERM sorting domain-containing protein n=1 Tax=Tundrisphaera lichenicola TaxID=2029860 RepID=UPI003EC12BC4